VKGFTDRLRAGLEEKYPSQDLGNAAGAFVRMARLEFDDLFPDRLGQLFGAAGRVPVLQTGFPLLPVTLDPSAQTAAGNPRFFLNHLPGIAFFQQQLDESQSFLE
jgi:hypothetical protein